MLKEKINMYIVVKLNLLGMCREKQLPFPKNRFTHSFKIDFLLYIQIILVFFPDKYYLSV